MITVQLNAGYESYNFFLKKCCSETTCNMFAITGILCFFNNNEISIHNNIYSAIQIFFQLFSKRSEIKRKKAKKTKKHSLYHIKCLVFLNPF